jgi:hypothetical protein
LLPLRVAKQLWQPFRNQISVAVASCQIVNDIQDGRTPRPTMAVFERKEIYPSTYREREKATPKKKDIKKMLTSLSIYAIMLSAGLCRPEENPIKSRAKRPKEKSDEG